jgi:hypothetical protein
LLIAKPSTATAVLREKRWGLARTLAGGQWHAEEKGSGLMEHHEPT